MARFSVNQFFGKKFFYALLVTSIGSSKLVHLLSHLESLPPMLMLVYAPTFWLQDFIVVIVGRLLFNDTSNYRRLSTLVAAIGALLAMLACLVTSSEMAFYIETKGEITWRTAGNIAHSRDAIRLLLSGSFQVLLCSLAISIVSFITKTPLYTGTGYLLHWTWLSIRGRSVPSTKVIWKDHERAEHKGGSYSAALTQHRFRLSRWLNQTLIVVPLVTVTILQIVRPKEQPYPDMSNTLPFNILQGLLSRPLQGYCSPSSVNLMTPFPLPMLLSPENWTPAHDLNPAWHPVVDLSKLNADTLSQIQRPSWIPGNGSIPGFARWTTTSGVPDLESYHPELDPLKLSNLDDDILNPIKESFQSSKTKIKHIVLLTLESTRADVFPLTTRSPLYDSILESHPVLPSFNISALNSLLAEITPVAELLTGTSNFSGFSSFRRSPAHSKTGSWRTRLAANASSINILGAITGSSMTLKSLLGSHCGVHPLPVYYTEEANLTSYQPCLPHILDLFNRNKPQSSAAFLTKPASTIEALYAAPWTPVFVQSSTDQFDRQDHLNAMMGFAPHNVFAKANLTDPHSKYWPPTEPESNYFGFPEAQVKPYLRELFKQVQEKGERLFLSHLTSQTHHPFHTPEDFEDEEYVGKSKWGSENVLNQYLNTIRYGDRWLGEVMDMLDEAGMTNETLVVLVGDHGMAFSEDTPRHSSYENPHISNFRIPLSFQHPSLPPLQLAINASSIHIIPTILDLLLSSGSLPGRDAEITRNILPQYQGQSLLRPLKTQDHGRELWTPTIIQTGGSMLSIGSAASPYRLALPICKPSEYRFTDISRDPHELNPLTAWSMDTLLRKLSDDSVKHQLGYSKDERQKASKWASDAERIARWWSWEGRRLWRFSGAAKQHKANKVVTHRKTKIVHRVKYIVVHKDPKRKT